MIIQEAYIRVEVFSRRMVVVASSGMVMAAQKKGWLKRCGGSRGRGVSRGTVVSRGRVVSREAEECGKIMLKM